MQIGCTKKTLEFLKKDDLPADPELDPFFTWTASVIVVDRRKALVLINDDTRCGVVLYGLTASVRKNLDSLIKEGIRQTLLAERIDPQLIERYLQDCGESVVYTKTRSRSAAARMNSVITELSTVPVIWLKDVLYQREVVRRINCLLYSIDGKYHHVRETLRKGFADHYGTKTPCSCTMLVLNMRLMETACFRQIRVPETFTLLQLHEVLRTSMCWLDAHLHAFYDENGLPMELPFSKGQPEGLLDEDDVLEAECQITVGQAFEQTSQLLYLYDFGGCWQHTLTLVRREEHSQDVDCRCLLAMGEAPPEDVGGPEQFQEFLRVMDHPDHPDYRDLLAWASDSCWCRLDVDAINRVLDFC